MAPTVRRTERVPSFGIAVAAAGSNAMTSRDDRRPAASALAGQPRAAHGRDRSPEHGLPTQHEGGVRDGGRRPLRFRLRSAADVRTSVLVLSNTVRLLRPRVGWPERIAGSGEPGPMVPSGPGTCKLTWYRGRAALDWPARNGLGRVRGCPACARSGRSCRRSGNLAGGRAGRAEGPARSL